MNGPRPHELQGEKKRLLVDGAAVDLGHLRPDQIEAFLQGQLVAVEMSTSHQSISGPIPPPQYAEAYERLLPGATNRLFCGMEEVVRIERMAVEADIEHARDCRNKNQIYRMAGLIGAIVVCCFFIACGTYVIVNANAWAGSFLAIAGPLTGLAGKFIMGRPLNDGEGEPKVPAPPPSAKNGPRSSKSGATPKPRRKR